MTTGDNRTYLAIDYGSRRMGVAKSDPTGLIASALATVEIKSLKEGLERLRELIGEYQPAGIVIGYPLLPSGDRGEKCREVDRFVEKLKASFDGPVYRVDESYSSEEAAAVLHAHGKQVGRDKGRLDRLAAVIILQRFLDELRRQ